jgi:signal transduction histidine kinase
VPLIDEIIDWLIGMFGAIILIEITFRAVTKLQNHLQNEIAERKQAEEELIQLNDVLKLINKILRHDILNDLTIVGNSIEVYSETKDEKLLKNALKAIDNSVQLIKKMRELESVASSGGSLKSYNVREVVEDVIKKYDIEFRVKGDCTVVADDALISVIDNIVRNAIVHGKTNRIDIEIRENNGMGEIRIADYGKGIPDELKEKIFEKDFTYGGNCGTGLGLYIVNKTVKRYGGSIYVEDNKPKGTIFTIRLSYPKGKIEHLSSP